MANQARRGAVIERKALALLAALGYKTYRCVRSPYPGQPNDIMGADIIAIRPYERVRVIQVTTKNVGIGRKAAEFDKWPWPKDHSNLQVFQWMGETPDGITRAEWRQEQYFRVRSRDYDYAIRPQDDLWFGGASDGESEK